MTLLKRPRLAMRRWPECASWIQIISGLAEIESRLKVMAESKLITMRDAIARHVPSGSMGLLGAQLEQIIPFAAGHELIRQGRRDLTLVGPISDILFDQMVGAGCVSRVMAAWVGNVSGGGGHL